MDRLFITSIEGSAMRSLAPDTPPALELVRRCIEGLDGEYVYTTQFNHDEDHYLTVVGGQNGRFNVVVYAGTSHHELSNPKAASGGPVVIAHGEHKYMVSPRYAVDLETAVAAATYYAVHGKPHPELDWR